MKLPMQAVFLVNNILKGAEREAPPGLDLLLQADWTTPTRTTAIDYQIGERIIEKDDVVNVMVTGLAPDGSTLTVLIQASGLKEIPEGLRRFTNGR
jgi:hypothetical protein